MDDLIPAIINRKAGTAAEAVRVLTAVGGFEIHEVDPSEIHEQAKAIAASNPKRILVCGGDGSVCSVANVVAESDIEVAIVPGGTLNHLARRLGLPQDLRAAALIARDGMTRTLDAGRVNGSMFLNTSSVGAYEFFVRRRDRLERWCGYHAASLIAGLWVLFRAPVTRVAVEVDGVQRVYRTPLVFLGVGERELRVPELGAHTAHGRRGLHLMIVRSRTGARLASLALQAAARGVHAVSRTPAMDSLIVDRCVIEVATGVASIDGELIAVTPPLEYEFMPDALSVVVGERREENRAS
jgi:diacylglycerol kinase family enzyme